MINLFRKYAETTPDTDFLYTETFSDSKFDNIVGWFQRLSVRQLRFGIFLTLFYIIPYIVLWATQWDMPYRHAFGGTVFFLLGVVAVVKRRTWHETGFRFDTLKPALLWSGALTLFFVALMLIVRHFNLVRVSAYPLTGNWQGLLLFYVFVVGPSQEFVFRSLLFTEMNRIGIHNPGARIIISGVLFALLHIHYCDWFTLGLTLGMGLLWSWLYNRHPNWFAITLSHGILGTVALLTHIV